MNILDLRHSEKLKFKLEKLPSTNYLLQVSNDISTHTYCLSKHQLDWLADGLQDLYRFINRETSNA